MPEAPPPARPPEPAPPLAPRRALLIGVACGLALFLGFVFAVNLLAQFRLSDYEYDPNHWWLSFRPLPRVFEQIFTFAAAILLVAFAAVPSMSGWRRRLTRTTVELLGVVAAWNAVEFYGALSGGRFHTSFPVPLALFLAAALAVVWLGAAAEKPARGPLGFGAMALAVPLAAIAFPLLQMICLGLNDHRPPPARASDVDAALRVAAVFGPTVLSNGDGGQTLSPRGRTAADLVHTAGVVEIYAAGSTEGPDSAWAARVVAAAAGFPAGKVELNRTGGDPTASVATIAAAFPKGDVLILSVADFYQLPRIDMLFAQQGRVTLPVPSRGDASFGMMLGEIPKLWKCYLGALTR